MTEPNPEASSTRSQASAAIDAAPSSTQQVCRENAVWLRRIAAFQPFWALLATAVCVLLLRLNHHATILTGAFEFLIAVGAIREFILLRRAAKHLEDYARTGDESSLAAALRSQRGHWALRFTYNLVALVVVFLYFAFFAIAAIRFFK